MTSRQIHLIVHPHEPGGWRWGVQLDEPDPTRLDRCVNAGWAETRDDADAAGQVVAYSCLSLMTVQLRLAAVIVPHLLDHDPLVGVDTLNPLHS